MNFPDYPLYGIRIEQLKTAYKTLFGLLDKIAFFMNAYYELGIAETDIDFRSIWYSKHYGKNCYEYRNTLNKDANFALASLYWISRDLYDRFESSPNPELMRIRNIRNALEHKYVKIVAGYFPERLNGDVDDLALYVSEDEMFRLTMELMKTAREAIICLSLCVNIEEKKREKCGDAIVVHCELQEFDDDWKV